MFIPSPRVDGYEMGLLETIRTRVGGSDAITECRHCGESVSHEAERCPACDSTEIAHYRC